MQTETSTAAAQPGTFLQWIDNKDPGANIFIRFIRSFLRVLLICVREFGLNELSLRSAALTYTILLSLVPMLAMGTAVVKGLGGGDELRELVYSYLNTLEETTTEFHITTPQGSEETSDDSSPAVTEVTPQETAKIAGDQEAVAMMEQEAAPSLPVEEKSPGSLTGHLRSAVDQLFDYVDNTNFATLGTFGVLGIIFSILLVLNHIESAMNAIWHVQDGRPLMRKLSDYITLLILMPISINVGFASTAVLSNQNLSDKLDILIPFLWLQALFFKLIPVFIIAVTLYVLYIFFPNTKVKSLPALTGAFIAAMLWFVAQNVYIALQVGVSRYNAIYGSFATFPLFLIWIYFGWVFILAGAQIAYATQKRNIYNLVTPPSVPSMSLSAAFDILQEVYTGYEEEDHVDNDRLKERLPSYSTRLIEDTLKTLLENNLLLQTHGKTGYLPAKPEYKLNKKSVIEAVLGKESPDTAGGDESKKTLTIIAESSASEAPPSSPEQPEEKEETTPLVEKS